MSLLRLTLGETALDLAPLAGGGIATFRWRGIDIMRPADPQALAARDPLGLAAFPLVPYSNRIAHGRFVWAGREIVVPRNFGAHPHAIHGVGWQRPWHVAHADGASARLVLDCPAGDWPWAFTAMQDFTLAPDGFDYALSVTNRDGTPMPAGLGIHPYFPNPPETTLGAGLDGWWRTDAFVMPLGAVAEARDDWTHRLHAGTTTDHVFSGLAGPVTLGWPGHRLTMRATPNARWLVVYAPAGDTITAVEPVTHPTDALNTPGHPGLVALAPGQTMTLGASFRCA